MCTLFLLTNITFDIDQNVKRHSMNAHQNSFGIWRVANAILYEKGCFFQKNHYFQKKIIASLVILQNEKRTST